MAKKKGSTSEFLLDPHKDKYENLDITVDNIYSTNDKEKKVFIKCVFRLTNEGVLDFSNDDFDECEFIGIDNLDSYYEDRGNLSFNNCTTIEDIKIKGEFKEIKFQESKLIDFIEESKVIDYTFEDSSIQNFIIKGECRTINMVNTNFDSDTLIESLRNEDIKELLKKGKYLWKKSLWNKRINVKATCDIVTFEKSKVDSYYLVSKCLDKKTLDLSNAKLIDNWSRLRKNYSGISLYIVFILTFLFFLPFITQSFFLVVTSKVDVINALPKIPLWEILIYGNKEGIQANIYCALTIVLLLYNTGRFLMTIIIARMREVEKYKEDLNLRSTTTHPDKYRLLLIIDKILFGFFWISFIYSMFKIHDALITMVPVI